MTKCITCVHSGVCKHKEAIENMDNLLADIVKKDHDVKDVIAIETGCNNYSSSYYMHTPCVRTEETTMSDNNTAYKVTTTSNI